MEVNHKMRVMECYAHLHTSSDYLGVILCGFHCFNFVFDLMTSESMH